jgi:hypothetical protein
MSVGVDSARQDEESARVDHGLARPGETGRQFRDNAPAHAHVRFPLPLGGDHSPTSNEERGRFLTPRHGKERNPGDGPESPAAAIHRPTDLTRTVGGFQPPAFERLQRSRGRSNIDGTRHNQVIMRSCLGLLLSAALLSALACNDDDSPPSSMTPTTTSAPPASRALIRAAQLSEDARTVDIAVNGEVIHRGLTYPGVTHYAELPPGDYRVQFLETGQRSAVAETTVSVSAGGAVTVAVVGLSTINAIAIQDDRTQTPNRARVRLFNAVSDYPDAFDLKVVNGDYVQRAVRYLQNTGYDTLIPGIYDLEIRRSPDPEVVAIEDGQGLYGNMVFTVFVVGTLRRDDIEIFLALDAS